MIIPEAGVATADPMAMHSRTRPSAPGVSPSSARTCGIREAQLAKSNPLTMNARYTDRRATATARPPGGPRSGTHSPSGKRLAFREHRL